MASIAKDPEKYEAASGQKLNMAKTSILFSRNTSATKKLEISPLWITGYSKI
jgi:hypothetical protein